jgi:hypothetical protein
LCDNTTIVIQPPPLLLELSRLLNMLGQMLQPQQRPESRRTAGALLRAIALSGVAGRGEVQRRPLIFVRFCKKKHVCKFFKNLISM